MFAVQPVAWGKFDERGADYTPTIAGAYRIASIWRAKYLGEDMMIWKMTSGDPIAWVRVYADERIDAVTNEHLSHLV